MMSKKGNVRLSWNDRPYPEQEDSWTLSKVKPHQTKLVGQVKQVYDRPGTVKSLAAP